MYVRFRFLLRKDQGQDHKATLKFLIKSMTHYGQPEITVTDKLRSYGDTMKNIGNHKGREIGGS